MAKKKITSLYLTILFIVVVIVGVYGFIVPLMVSVDNDIVTLFGVLLASITPLFMVVPVKSLINQINKL